jgi:signal transduction histidine kinase
MQKRMTNSSSDSIGLIDEIRNAWKKDFTEGGFDVLVKNWKEPSKILPKHNLFQEDLDNLEKVSGELRDQNANLTKDIQFVKEEGERIGKIVNAMRRLGHFESKAEAQSIHALLRDCCYIMADLFDQKNIAVKQDFKAANDLCIVDRDEMIQAITNLMRNSLQAIEGSIDSPLLKKAPGASPYMMVGTRNDGSDLFVEIEDNGVGVSSENQSLLFESSFTTKTPDEGTGLGLGIARRFVRGQGGEIEFVSSKPFEKTVFRIKLPVTEGNRKGAVA